MRLQGKTALITGGARGIGRAIALGLAGEGATVAIGYHSNATAAEEVVREVETRQGHAFAVQVDLGVPDQIKEFVSTTLNELGGAVDILVNNAGEVSRQPILDTTIEAFDRVVAVDLRGPFLLTQAIARQMVDRSIRGSIVNITSISAQHSFWHVAPYQAAKAGLGSLTRSFALELAEYGIRVNAVALGVTATEINRERWEGQPEFWARKTAGIPLGRAGAPEDHVGAVVFLASDEASWITGTTVVVDGGQSSWSGEPRP